MIYRTALTCFMLTLGSFQLFAAQNTRLSDSLVSVLNTYSEKDTSRMKLLSALAQIQTDPQEQLKYAGELLDLALPQKNYPYLYRAYLYQGQAFRLMGDVDVAIYAFFKALNYAETAQIKMGISSANASIADTYSMIDNRSNAVLYYKRAINTLEASDKHLLAKLFLNLGDEFYMSMIYDSALYYFKTSEKLFENLETDELGLAYSQGNIGLVYIQQGQQDPAFEKLSASLKTLRALKDYYAISRFLGSVSDIYAKQGNLQAAEIYADSSELLAERNGFQTVIRDNTLRLADIFDNNLDYERSYELQRHYVSLKDSISDDEIFAKIQNLENAFAFAKKQTEVDLLKSEKRNQQIILITTGIVAFVLTILLVVIFRYYRAKTRINKLLEEQKKSLVSLNHTKDKFLSIISHDLRGPISAFHGISRIIDDALATKNHEDLFVLSAEIDSSVKNMSTLLDNLLSWALQQQGQFPYEPVRLNVREMILHIMDTLRNLATGKGIEMICDIDQNSYIIADRNSTLTIFRNLINNALKFTPENGTVTASCAIVDDACQIVISDTGVGISEDRKCSLFGEEYHESTFGTSGESGLGLGLRLVKEFVDMNKGTLKMESEPGQGTSFMVSLKNATWEPVESK